MPNQVIEPELPSLPDETDPDSPLRDYEPESFAQRQLEIDESEGQQGEPSVDQEAQQLGDATRNLRRSVDNLKNDAPKQGGDPGELATGSAETGSATATEGAGAAATQAAGEAGSATAASSEAAAAKSGWLANTKAKAAAGRAKIAAAKSQALKEARAAAARLAQRKGLAGATGRLAATLLSEAAIPIIGWIMGALTVLWLAVKTKLGKWILLGIAAVIILPGILFMLLSLSIGTSILPSTPAQKFAATKTLALSDDPSAKATVIITQAQSLKKSFETSKNTATKKYKNDATKLNAATQEANSIIAQLDQLIAVVNNLEERKKIIPELNAKIEAFSTSYPELVFGAGTCADLQPFIESGQFVVSSGPNAKEIVKGRMITRVNGASPASQELCGTLVYALRAGFKIQTNTFSYGHNLRSGNGRISAHSCGAAIDIGRVNDEKVRPGSQETKKFLDTIRQGHTDGKIRIQQLISPYKSLYVSGGKFGSYTDSGHDDHIHLSGRPANPTCMKTGQP